MNDYKVKLNVPGNIRSIALSAILTTSLAALPAYAQIRDSGQIDPIQAATEAAARIKNAAAEPVQASAMAIRPILIPRPKDTDHPVEYGASFTSDLSL